MVSHQLVEQWRVRLAAWQQRLDEGRPRPWLARAYVRVLSYMLSQYTAQADAEPPLERIETARPVDADLTPPRSAMKLQVAALDLSGKAPRTATTIRSVLETVQENVPQAQQGPLIGGLRPDDPILVTAFYSLVEISRLLRMLEAEGIGWQVQRSGRKVQVLVRMADLERAKPIVSRHAADAHDSPRWRYEGVRGIQAGLLTGLLLAVILPLPLTAWLVSRGEPLIDAVAGAVALAICVVTIAGPCGSLAGHIWGIVATHKVWRRKSWP